MGNDVCLTGTKSCLRDYYGLVSPQCHLHRGWGIRIFYALLTAFNTLQLFKKKLSVQYVLFSLGIRP